MKAVITGASSGIGESMAYYLNEKDIDLILVATNEEKLQKVKSKLKETAKIIVCDLRYEEEVFKLYEKLKGEDIDIFINNAGFGNFGEFFETDLSNDLDMINTNIKAVHILTKYALKNMIKEDSGYILNVASSAAFVPGGPLMSTYYATKSYVYKLTEAINYELKKKNLNKCSFTTFIRT